MKSWKVHLRIAPIKLLCLVSLFLIACKEKELKPDDFVAKVNDEYLLKEELTLFLSENDNDSSKIQQYIRKWVRDRVLINLAKKRELEKEQKYTETIDKIKNDILISTLLNEILSESLERAEEELIEEFYNNHQELFVLNEELFEMNVAIFQTEQYAQRFNKLKNNSFIEKIEHFNDKYDEQIESYYRVYKGYNFQSKHYYNSVRSLSINQYSRPIKTEQNSFHIVQLISKSDAGTLPRYNLIKDEVKELYSVYKRKEIINNFLSRSFDEYDIEIREEWN